MPADSVAQLTVIVLVDGADAVLSLSVAIALIS